MSTFVESLALPRIALAVVAAHYEIPPQRFRERSATGRPRGARVVSHARMLAAWIAKTIGGEALSYPTIGHALGIDHSSVINACRQTEKALGEDTQLRKTVSVLALRVRLKFAEKNENDSNVNALAQRIQRKRSWLPRAA